MFRRIVIVLFVMMTLALATNGFAANADTASFSIAPPPIADPVFDDKEGNMKVRATYLTMESNDTAATGSKFELKGYGVDVVARKAFNTVLAIDGGVGVMYLDGDMGSGTLTGAAVPITFNLEVQPYKNDVFNVILFAGPQFSITAMTVDMAGSTYTIDSYVYGVQVGAQMGLNIGDTIGIDVFGMTLTQSGTQDVYSSYGDYSYDIPSYTTTSFGVDFVYLPWGLALSSVLQEANKDESTGMKTHMYQLSWTHKF